MTNIAYPVPMPEFEKPRQKKVLFDTWEAGVVAEKALGGYQFGTYKPVTGKPFGFISSIHGDVFAYGLGDKIIKVVYNTIDMPKGLRVSEWRHATADDIATVNAAIEKTLTEKQAEVDRRCRELAEDAHRRAVKTW